MTLAIDHPPERAAVTAAPPRTIADLVRRLGDVPAERILLHPLPGTATERDVAHAIEVDQRLVELVDGTLVEKPMGEHEDQIAFKLGLRVGLFVEQHSLGIMGGSQGMKRMLGGNIRSPDITFTASDRLTYAQSRSQAANPVAPDLSIEVLSPSNSKREMLNKRREFFASGTRLIWEFEPADRTVAIYTSPEQPDAVLDATATLAGGDVLPGFALDLAPFWSQFDD